MATAPDARSALRAVSSYLQDSVTSEADRASTLLDIVRAFYDFTKFSAPGGDGIDGRDGAERTGLGEVLDEANRHWMAAAQRRLAASSGSQEQSG